MCIIHQGRGGHERHYVRMLHIYFCWCVKRWPVDISPGVEEIVSARLVTRWPTAPRLTPAPAEIIKIRTKIRARPQQPAQSVVSVVYSDQQQTIMMARWHNGAATRVSAFTDKLYPRSFIKTQYLEMRLAVPGPGTVLTNCYVNVLIRSCGQQRAGHKR